MPGRAVELAARVRLESARRPWVRWAVVAACALTVGAMVQAHSGRLDAARQAWGERQSVLVTRHALARGEQVGPDDVQAVELPVAALPRGTLTDLPRDAIAVDAMAAGEVVSVTHVRRRGGGDLPPGTSGIAVPVVEGGLQLTVGQQVDVVRATDPLDGGDVGVAAVLARRALVVDVSPSTILVAVTTSAAPAAAAAAARGAVVLILSEM
jgi:Flp pilus assembly protein CpaB